MSKKNAIGHGIGDVGIFVSKKNAIGYKMGDVYLCRKKMLLDM